MDACYLRIVMKLNKTISLFTCWIQQLCVICKEYVFEQSKYVVFGKMELKMP